jgi:uroporphyrinogen-III synthase
VPNPPPVLLLTRPRAQSEGFLRRCEAAAGRRIEAVIAPILEIVPLDAAVDLSGLGGVIFTSANAVSALGDVPGRTGLRAWCVGAQTADAARAAGFDAVAAEGDADALLAMILRERPDGPLLHLSGVHRAADVAQRLEEAGIAARTQAVYDQVARPVSGDERRLLSGSDRRVILPLFSPRSARLLRDAVPEIGDAVLPLAISANVASAWGTGPRPVRVADAPDAAAMATLVVTALNEDAAC